MAKKIIALVTFGHCVGTRLSTRGIQQATENVDLIKRASGTHHPIRILSSSDERCGSLAEFIRIALPGSDVHVSDILRSDTDHHPKFRDALALIHEELERHAVVVVITHAYCIPEILKLYKAKAGSSVTVQNLTGDGCLLVHEVPDEKIAVAS